MPVLAQKTSSAPQAMPVLVQKTSSRSRGLGSSTAQSRSTSAGSSTAAGSSLTGDSTPAEGGVPRRCTQRPEFNYPVHVTVRNTFIDIRLERPTCLESVCELRRSHSAPGLGLLPVDVEPCEEEAKAAAAAAAADEEETPLLTAEETAEANATSSMGLRVLRLADTLREPELGSAELPTEGSRQHRFGTCKPCAFVHAKGCGNGTACQFCHICAPGEKKRRQKEKMGMRRDATRVEGAFNGLMGAAWTGFPGQQPAVALRPVPAAPPLQPVSVVQLLQPVRLIQQPR